MELFVSLAEIKEIVAKDLTSRGFKINTEQADFRRHVEGQYEDSREVIDGLAFLINDQKNDKAVCSGIFTTAPTTGPRRRDGDD
jgi:hypothetical protein